MSKRLRPGRPATCWPLSWAISFRPPRPTGWRRSTTAHRCHRAGARANLVVAYARTLRELGDSDGTEALANFGLSVFPLESRLSLLVGQMYLAQSKWQDALPWFQRTLALSPENADAYYGMGQVALGLGGREEAGRQLMRALRVNPYHADAARMLQELQLQSAQQGGPS